MRLVNEIEMNNDGNEQFICCGLFSVRATDGWLVAAVIGLMSGHVIFGDET